MHTPWVKRIGTYTRASSYHRDLVLLLLCCLHDLRSGGVPTLTRHCCCTCLRSAHYFVCRRVRRGGAGSGIGRAETKTAADGAAEEDSGDDDDGDGSMPSWLKDLTRQKSENDKEARAK